MDVEVGYNLYLPPNYETDKGCSLSRTLLAARDEPVGIHRSVSARYLDDGIKAGTIKPMIVV